MSNVEITKREVLFSIIIFFIMLGIGFFVVGAVTESTIEDNQKYYKAIQIDNDPEIFEYSMKTNVGNALISGEISANEPVTSNDIEGSYFQLEKHKERYTKHTRNVTKTKMVNGKSQTYTTTETYYTWDHINSEKEKTETFKFLEKQYPVGLISIRKQSINNLEEIIKDDVDGYVRFGYLYEDRIASVGDYRYYWEYIPESFSATLFSDLRNNTINNTKVYKDKTIDRIIADKQGEEQTIKIFAWIGWIFVTGLVIFAFIYFENKWLED